MSMLNVEAVVSTLKWTVSPLLTLISVAKPCRLGSPAPLMSHSVAGLPGCWFSQTIGFAWGSHGCCPSTTCVERAIAAAMTASTNWEQRVSHRSQDEVDVGMWRGVIHRHGCFRSISVRLVVARHNNVRAAYEEYLRVTRECSAFTQLSIE